jgi:CubicO group peptidase (beta-lactamase class C family)
VSRETPRVQGTVEPGFEAVREAFEQNLRARGELGGACALVRGDRRLVDLWGGRRVAGEAAPWTRDTVALVYSVTKGVAAAALAWLHARGRLDYEAPVAALWPEFAQQGKQDVSLRRLLAHEAGLARVDARLEPALLGDLDALAEVLARQRPAWPPGRRHAYHAFSLGFYENEIARRADVRGRSLGGIVREEIAAPLGEHLSLGLPADLPAERVARIEPVRPWRLFLHPRSLSPRFALALACPWSLTARSIRNPRLAGPAALDGAPWRGLELPSSNGYAGARVLATLYADLAGDGTRLGVDAATRALLAAPARVPPQGEGDAVFHRRTAYALGFMKPSRDFRFGSGPGAFGAPGVGGSFAFADPATRTGYAYVTNRLGFCVFDDRREQALRRACAEALAREGA